MLRRFSWMSQQKSPVLIGQQHRNQFRNVVAVTKALQFLKINWRIDPIIDDTMSLLFSRPATSTEATEMRAVQSCFWLEIGHGQVQITAFRLSGVSNSVWFILNSLSQELSGDSANESGSMNGGLSTGNSLEFATSRIAEGEFWVQYFLFGFVMKFLGVGQGGVKKITLELFEVRTQKKT